MEKIDFYYLVDILNTQSVSNNDNIMYSDLHIRSGKKIYIRKNGVLETHTSTVLSNEEVLNIISQIIEYKYKDLDEKIHQEVLDNLKNNGKEIDMSIELPLKGGGKPIYRARLNLFKTNGGYGLVLRIIPKKIKSLEELNFYSEHNEIIKKFLRRKEGLILITGQTGSGKSTTMAAMLNEINTYYNKHIITIEDPVEFFHEDKKSLITHREVGFYSDTKTFESGIRASLREDPDVIQIGEMRDAETALSALQAAQTGHIVLATLHTNNAPETILRLIDMFPSDKTKGVKNSLANSLLMILSQRLVRNVNGDYILAYEILTKSKAISTTLLKDNFNDAAILDTMASNMTEGMFPLNYCLRKRVEETSNTNLKITLENALETTYDQAGLQSLLKNGSGSNSTSSSINIRSNEDKWDK